MYVCMYVCRLNKMWEICTVPAGHLVSLYLWRTKLLNTWWTHRWKRLTFPLRKHSYIHPGNLAYSNKILGITLSLLLMITSSDISSYWVAQFQINGQKTSIISKVIEDGEHMPLRPYSRKLYVKQCFSTASLTKSTNTVWCTTVY